MAEQHDAAIALTTAYFEHWTRGDSAASRALLTEDASIVLPMSGDGSPEPGFVFEGADAAVGYLQFSHGTFESLDFHDVEKIVSEDARHVHVHARGNMVVKADGRPYRNVYVFRFDLRDGMISHVEEVTNPIAWANLGLA